MAVEPRTGMGFREARPKAVEVNRAMTGRTGVEVDMVGRCRLNR